MRTGYAILKSLHEKTRVAHVSYFLTKKKKKKKENS
jgi:hypothetical protein